MLIRKNLCGSHDTCLIAIIYSKQGCQQGYDSLSTTYITLKQTIHLLTRFQVCLYLTKNSFLRISQRERERVILLMKRFPNNRHTKTFILFTTFHLSQNLQLNIKEFFKLQPFTCLLHGNIIFRKMNICQCLAEWHKVLLLN